MKPRCEFFQNHLVCILLCMDDILTFSVIGILIRFLPTDKEGFVPGDDLLSGPTRRAPGDHDSMEAEVCTQISGLH